MQEVLGCLQATAGRDTIMKRGKITSNIHGDKEYRIELPESEIELRDYFAAQAIHCFQLQDKDMDILVHEQGRPMHEVAAKFCYGLADAMMKERER